MPKGGDRGGIGGQVLADVRSLVTECKPMLQQIPIVILLSLQLDDLGTVQK
jgi:hypothetical protein